MELTDPQLALQNVLRKRLLAFQAGNPSFSLRAFARRLEISPGAASGLLNGKRKASSKLALRLAERLLLDPQEKALLLTAGRGAPVARPEALVLEADQFRLLAEWEHLAILSLLRTKNFRSSPAWMARRLGISPSRVTLALRRMVKLGLVRRAAGGKFVRSAERIRTSDNVRDLAIQKFHDENLTLARGSLHRDGINDRDFTAVTFAVDPERLEQAKVLIRKFQDDLTALLEGGDKTEVYRFSTQLFPLTIPPSAQEKV